MRRPACSGTCRRDGFLHCESSANAVPLQLHECLPHSPLLRRSSPRSLPSAGASFAASPATCISWPTCEATPASRSSRFTRSARRRCCKWCCGPLCAAGARLAGPGEFTLRAFLAGRIDLTQAEAVLGVIDADDAPALDAALGQLAGGLARPLHRLRDDLLDLLAHVEAGFDFADEDLPFITREELDRRLAEAESQRGRRRAADGLPRRAVDAVQGRAASAGRTPARAACSTRWPASRRRWSRISPARRATISPPNSTWTA